MVKLDDARAPRRDERVLRRDEEAVEQHKQPDGKQLESECHAPAPKGVPVLEGRSSTSELASIGDATVVIDPPGTADDDEPLEVGERLCNGEATLDRRERRPEQIV